MAARTDLFLLLMEEILIEEGLNVRVDMGDLQELADSIVEVGIKIPIQAYQKRGDINRYTVLDGHRRVAAVALAISQGKLNPKEFRFPMVKCKNVSDVDRVLGMVNFNSGKPLNKLEEATAYQRAIAYGALVSEVAQKTGKKVPYINDCLSLLSAGVSTKKLLNDGVVSPSLVITMLKKKEPSVVDAELQEAYKIKKVASVKTADIKGFVSTDIDVPVRNTNVGNDDIVPMSDNVKTTGVSGMDLPSDSGTPIKITKKNLEKEPKAKTYTKEYIIALLQEHENCNEFLPAAEFLANELE